MNKLECGIVRDLMPLYVEQLISEKTEQMIEEHIQNCPACKEEALRMSKSIQMSVEVPKADKKVVRYLNSIRIWYFLCPTLALGLYMLGNKEVLEVYMEAMGLFASVCLLSYTSGICGVGFDYDQLGRQMEANERSRKKWGDYRVSPFLLALPASIVCIMYYILTYII